MALTDPELYEIARQFSRRIFAAATAHSDLDQLKTAVGRIDTGMNVTTNQLQSAYPATAVKIAFLTDIKAQAPNLTTQEAGIALAYWALHEVGLL